jgi:hypothetical protein
MRGGGGWVEVEGSVAVVMCGACGVVSAGDGDVNKNHEIIISRLLFLLRRAERRMSEALA